MANVTKPLLHDVLIIGGGPAGLASATALARQLVSTVVFDSGAYRNARTYHMHNVLGFDHQDPKTFRAKARSDLLARYNTTTFVDRTVARIERTPQGFFKAVLTSGEEPDKQHQAADVPSTWYGRRLVLAAGVRDIYPDIEGFDACWGRGIFHCLFCDGYESRGGASAGVLAGGMAMANTAQGLMHLAWMASPLAKAVTIYTNGNDGMAAELGVLVTPGMPFRVDGRKIVRVEMSADRGQEQEQEQMDGESSEIILHFEGGASAKEAFLAHGPKTEANNNVILKELGVELNDNGDIKTTGMFGETGVPNVLAAGDCMILAKAVAPAASAGGMAGAGLVVPLRSEPKVELEL